MFSLYITDTHIIFQMHKSSADWLKFFIHAGIFVFNSETLQQINEWKTYLFSQIHHTDAQTTVMINNMFLSERTFWKCKKKFS